MKNQILFMGSDSTLCCQFYSFLRRSGLNIHHMKSLRETVEAFSQNEYCLAILDLQEVDDYSIRTVCMLQTSKPIPMLVITNCISSSQKIELFQAGVHAHTEKPVDIDVCIAQVNSLIRLYKTGILHDQQDEIAFGAELMIQLRFRQVFACGERLELTRKEFDLLCFLAQNPCQVFNYEQLYLHVWKDEYAFGGGDTVKVHIGTLRKKLSPIRKNCIQNVWGIGYKFVPPNWEIETL